MIIPGTIKNLIASAPLAHLTTLNPDGSPQVTVVWIGIQDDQFVCGHMSNFQKIKNIKKDPRVVLSMLGHGMNSFGLQEYLVVYGNAHITEGGGADLLQRLAHVYLGPAAEFPPEPFRSQPGYVTHIIPQRFTGNGPWSE